MGGRGRVCICGAQGAGLTRGWCWFSAFNGARTTFFGVPVLRLIGRTTMVSVFFMCGIFGSVVYVMSMCWGMGTS